MKYNVDLHTHSIASGHAYSTLKENIVSAHNKGLDCYGISEHGPRMPGGPHIFHFQNFKVIPRSYKGMRVICGVELNIVDLKGSIDLTQYELDRIDYAIASLHHVCLKSGTVEENTHAVTTAMKYDFVNILGHPDDSQFPLDYDAIIQAAKAHHVLIELNNSSLDPKSFRVNSRENNIELLNRCKIHAVPILLGSDAHIDEDVGNFDNCNQLLDEIGFPDDLIANHNIDLLSDYIPAFRTSKLKS